VLLVYLGLNIDRDEIIESLLVSLVWLNLLKVRWTDSGVLELVSRIDTTPADFFA